MESKNQIAHRADSSWPQRFSKWESASVAMLNYTNVPAFRDDERAQLEAISEETRKRLEAASPQDIGKIIAKIAIGCRHAPGDNTDRKALAALMVEYLLGYPRDILSAAADEWIKTQIFFPSIAEFRALCEPEFKRRRNGFASMRQALERSEEKARAALEEEKRRAEWAKPEKRAELEKLTATAWRKLGGRVERAPMRPTMDPAEKARIARICDDARAKDKAAKLHREQSPD